MFPEMATYPMHVAGLTRELPICKVNDELYIGAFIMFGDAELTVACARDMLALAKKGIAKIFKATARRAR